MPGINRIPSPFFSFSYNKILSPLCSTEDAQVIFRDAATFNMTDVGHVWIVTEQALSANNTPDGVLGLQLEHFNSDSRHIRVSTSDSCNSGNCCCHSYI